MDTAYTLEVLRQLMAIDSPSGFTASVMDCVERLSDYPCQRTHKGNCIITIPGEETESVGFCAHVDTLGLMVRSIKDNGALAVTPVGGPIAATLDSELCRLHTRDGQVYDGTVFFEKPAAHVYKESRDQRTFETLEVRLDVCADTAEAVRALGVDHGDYVCIDPKLVMTDTGFIKSRFLDDKLSVAILLGLAHHYAQAGKKPRQTLKLLISSYEEVGHGMAWIPQDLHTLIAVDMGCIGDDLACSEYDVSICAKDSSGPYDYALTSRLIQLAKAANLDYAVDIYPFYGSDVSAALSGGNDLRGALIGPGVFASHGYERSHVRAVANTMKLLDALWEQGIHGSN